MCEGILRTRINFFGRCFFNRIFSLIIYIVIKRQNLPVNVTIISDSSICIRRGFQPEWSLLASLSKLAIGLMAEFAPRNLAGSTLKALKFLFCQLYTNRENAQLRKSDLWVISQWTYLVLSHIHQIGSSVTLPRWIPLSAAPSHSFFLATPGSPSRAQTIFGAVLYSIMLVIVAAGRYRAVAVISLKADNAQAPLLIKKHSILGI